MPALPRSLAPAVLALARGETLTPGAVAARAQEAETTVHALWPQVQAAAKRVAAGHPVEIEGGLVLKRDRLNQEQP